MTAVRPTPLRITLALTLVAGVAMVACADEGEPPTGVSTETAPAVVTGLSHTPPQAMAHGSHRNFNAHLSGDEEVPPVDTRAQGQAIFQLSRDGTELHYKLIVANIENVAQAHIHIGEAGVNGPVVVWLYPSGPPPQLIEGRFSGVLAEGTITADNFVGQWAGLPLETLLDAAAASAVYVNVHTQQNPPGEVRGQIR